MGCPARSVSGRGAGAALILTPEIAKEIVIHTKKGVESWLENGLKGAKIKPSVIKRINSMNENRRKSHDVVSDETNGRKSIPVSVKTRVGYDKKIASEWIKHLTEVEPVVISLHGRTLKQMYSGEADWSEIEKAVSSTHIPILGNGDIKSSNDAVRMLNETGCAGVLIGRASFGNPWIYCQKDEIKKKKKAINDCIPSPEERAKVVMEHAKLHWDTKGPKGFVQMRKNLAWYFKGFDGASMLREKLVRVDNFTDVEKILKEESWLKR
jgi:tRNA-dihydrouridine synthase